MARLLPLLLLLVPLLLAIVAVIGTIATVIRWGFRIGVALVAALLARLLLPAQAGGGWLPLMVFVAMLLLLTLTSRRRRRLRPAATSEPRTIDHVPTGPGPAWPALRAMADWRTRRRFDAAREACERYLLLAEAHEDETAQLPIKIRKHLPTIVADCVRHCRTATRDEQRTLIADTLDTVETIAARAEERRRELAHLAQGNFRTLKSHLTRPDD